MVSEKEKLQDNQGRHILSGPESSGHGEDVFGASSLLRSSDELEGRPRNILDELHGNVSILQRAWWQSASLLCLSNSTDTYEGCPLPVSNKHFIQTFYYKKIFPLTNKNKFFLFFDGKMFCCCVRIFEYFNSG